MCTHILTLVDMGIIFLILHVCKLSYFPSLSSAVLSHVIAYPRILSFPLSRAFHDTSKKLEFILCEEHPRPLMPSHFYSTRKHRTSTHVAFVSVSRGGNEAAEMCPWCVMSCVRVFEWVTCQMWSVLLQKKNNVMKVALPAVKRIQCSVEAQIQLALWAPWNGDNAGW